MGDTPARTQWVNAGVKLNTTTLGGVTRWGCAPGSSILAGIHDGAVYPDTQWIAGASPRASVSTTAIATAIGAVAPTTTAIAGAGALLYQQLMAAGPTRSTGRVLTLARGLLVPRSLTAGHLQTAAFGFDVVPTFDGTNNPVIPAAATVPTAVDAEQFVLGKATVGGVDLGGVTDVAVNFGINEIPLGHESDTWPTECVVGSITPSIVLTGADALWFDEASGFGLLGGAAAHADTTIYLKKRDAGGTYETGSLYVKITMAGLVTVQQVDVAGVASVGLLISGEHDGTNAPLVIATAQAGPS